MDPREPLETGDAVAVEHLWNAAHEMLSAMRGLLDAADEFVESQRGRSTGPRQSHQAREGRVHHIDIDLDRRTEYHAPVDIDVDADAS